MSMSINAFKGALNGGGARSNLFEVFGTFPNGSAENLRFLIKSASLPASNLGEIIVPYRGRELKIAGDRKFDPWTVTVMNTTDFNLRKAFEDWSEQINSNETNEANIVNLDQYFQDWKVSQLDRSGQAVVTYTLKGCFPQTIGAIEVSHENENQIETFEVTLQYQYWTRADGGADAGVQG